MINLCHSTGARASSTRPGFASTSGRFVFGLRLRSKFLSIRIHSRQTCVRCVTNRPLCPIGVHCVLIGLSTAVEYTQPTFKRQDMNGAGVIMYDGSSMASPDLSTCVFCSALLPSPVSSKFRRCLGDHSSADWWSPFEDETRHAAFHQGLVASRCDWATATRRCAEPVVPETTSKRCWPIPCMICPSERHHQEWLHVTLSTPTGGVAVAVAICYCKIQNQPSWKGCAMTSAMSKQKSHGSSSPSVSTPMDWRNISPSG
eukprot:FR736970.1.p1 GENE.FR736970.1~~FR736970.1.p1  ORF type:complete len:258 (-),score=2.53 FR736970.1:15-788(-)